MPLCPVAPDASKNRTANPRARERPHLGANCAEEDCRNAGVRRLDPAAVAALSGGPVVRRRRRASMPPMLAPPDHKRLDLSLIGSGQRGKGVWEGGMSDETQPFAEWIGRRETVEEEIAAAPAQAAAATLDDTETHFRRGDGAAATVALVLLPAEGAAIAHRRRRPPATRRLPAADPVAATDVRRLPPRSSTAPLRHRPAGAPPWRHPLRLAEGRAQRHARLRHRRLHHPPGRAGLHRGGAGHRLSRAGSGRRRRRCRRRCRHRRRTPGCGPSSPPIRCCCSASRHSPSTATASTTTGRMPLDVEGYPGLVVHGPLTAVLLMELLRRTRGPAGGAVQLPRPGAAVRSGPVPGDGGGGRRYGQARSTRSGWPDGYDRDRDALLNRYRRTVLSGMWLELP